MLSKNAYTPLCTAQERFPAFLCAIQANLPAPLVGGKNTFPPLCPTKERFRMQISSEMTPPGVHFQKNEPQAGSFVKFGVLRKNFGVLRKNFGVLRKNFGVLQIFQKINAYHPQLGSRVPQALPGGFLNLLPEPPKPSPGVPRTPTRSPELNSDAPKLLQMYALTLN